MRTALILSAVLHVALFLIALFGLPQLLEKEELTLLQEIPVDVVEVGPMTIARLEEPREQPKPPPPKPTPPKPQPTPPPPAKEEPPPPPPVKAPEPPKPEPKPEPPKPEPPPPEPEPTPEPPKKEEPKPEPPKQVAEKPEPKKEEKKPDPPKKEEKKPEPKPEPKKEEPPKRSFDSVLKNVLKDAPKSQPQKDAPKQQETAESQPAPVNAKAGERLTLSEEDSLRAQMRSCWNVDPGAKGVNEMRVEVRVFFDAAMRVQKTEYAKLYGSLSDPRYRSFAESALRAPLLPACSTLRLPVDKYADKGTIVMNFTPKDMF